MPDRVSVRWLDHFYEEGPCSPEELTNTCVQTTMGFLVRARDDLVSVAATREEMDGVVKWHKVQHIYRALIVGEIEVLPPEDE